MIPEDWIILEDNRILNLSTRIPSALSVICSAYIIYSVMTNYQKRSSPTQRIVAGMSFADIIFSFFMFLGSWPLPHDSKNAYGAVGNMQTCTMQGFFLQLGMMAPLYNGLLALYCYLYVCRDWGGQRLRNIEVYGHFFVFLLALFVAIIYIPMELYNPHGIVCWVEPYPETCTQSFQSVDGTTDCERGNNAYLYQNFVYGAILWIMICWSCFSMAKVYLHIRKQEMKMYSYTSQYMTTRSSAASTGADSRDVAIRGALFTGAFLLAYIPPTITHSFEFFGKYSFPLELATVIILPCQGIFNFFVFIIHPEVKRHLQQKDKKRKSRRPQVSTMPMSEEVSKCEQQQQPPQQQHDATNSSVDEVCVDDLRAQPSSDDFRSDDLRSVFDDERKEGSSDDFPPNS